MDIRAFVVIPAKGDSKRLVGKNKRIIDGKSLVAHSIEYALNSEFAKRIIVSTEDEETAAIASSYGVEVVGREKEFMGEREVADVYVDIFDKYGGDEFTHVVGVQPDHPDRTIQLDKMLTYAVENDYGDLFTVNEDGSRNGSVRLFNSSWVKNGTISRRVGSMMDKCTNIHSEEDLQNAELNILRRK